MFDTSVRILRRSTRASYMFGKYEVNSVTLAPSGIHVYAPAPVPVTTYLFKRRFAE